MRAPKKQFPINFGRGDYKLQPIYVGDLASAALEQAGAERNMVVNAIGPETFTYRELVRTVRGSLGLQRALLSLPPALGYWGCRTLGWLVRDVVMTREEISGLMEGRLCVEGPPLGNTKLTTW